MVRAVQTIEQDIQRLNEALGAIAQDLYTAYETYLNTLGEALGKQLMLASYHLCTRGYPDRFLALSFSQRQHLQQALRQLGKRSQQQLHQLLTFPKPLPPAKTTPSVLDVMIGGHPAPEDEPVSDPVSSPEAALPDPPPAPPLDRPLSPHDMVRWRDDLERAIAELLQEISHEANRLLQRTQVLSSALPEPVLEVASKADMLADASGPPNLLKLRIEAESDNNDEAETAQLVVIHLRLSEIEFSDPTFSLKRAKIRELCAQLSHIGHDYARVHREKAIAEAEAAWRSSWYED
jgi:hypothetical protein